MDRLLAMMSKEKIKTIKITLLVILNTMFLKMQDIAGIYLLEKAQLLTKEFL